MDKKEIAAQELRRVWKRFSEQLKHCKSLGLDCSLSHARFDSTYVKEELVLTILETKRY